MNPRLFKSGGTEPKVVARKVGLLSEPEGRLQAHPLEEARETAFRHCRARGGAFAPSGLLDHLQSECFLSNNENCESHAMRRAIVRRLAHAVTPKQCLKQPPSALFTTHQMWTNAIHLAKPKMAREAND